MTTEHKDEICLRKRFAMQKKTPTAEETFPRKRLAVQKATNKD